MPSKRLQSVVVRPPKRQLRRSPTPEEDIDAEHSDCSGISIDPVDIPSPPSERQIRKSPKRIVIDLSNIAKRPFSPLATLWDEYKAKRAHRVKRSKPKSTKLFGNREITIVKSEKSSELTREYIKSLTDISRHQRRRLFRKLYKQNQQKFVHEENSKLIDEFKQKYGEL